MSAWLKRALFCALFTGGVFVVGTGTASADGLPTHPGGLIEQVQAATNSNTTDQSSDANAQTTQVNVNAPISILSFGSSNGDVDQSNDAHTGAVAGNSNETTHGIAQDQRAESEGASGHGCGCDDEADVSRSQDGSNENSTGQTSNAEDTTEQRNLNLPVSILGFGSGGGDVSQGNDATTRAWAENANATSQEFVQEQSATAGPGDACGSGCHATSGGDASQSQDAHNGNRTGQESNATSGTSQENRNVPVSVLGGFGCGGCGPSVDHGCGCQQPTDDHGCACQAPSGDVTQGNDAHTTAVSSNTNATHQGIGQSQDATSTGDGGGSCPSTHSTSCGCEGDGGGIDQAQNGSNANGTRQSADVDASTEQSNENSPFPYVGLGSAGGDVEQANDATTRAWSLNDNATAQWIGQAQSAATGGGDA